MNCIFARGLALAVLSAGTVACASADLIFDRGLPTANLNNAAGSSRSNVAWADDGWFTGDDFTLSAGTHNIMTIRTWVVGDVAGGLSFSSLYSSLTLWLGTPGGSFPVSATGYGFTATKVQYAGGSDYQGTSGTFKDLWQIDWNTSGLVLTGGSAINFGISGVTTAAGASALGGANRVFNHASNAFFSGSTQDGSDGKFREWFPDGSYSNDWDSGAVGGGWDKSSDINIQILTTPEPFTMTLGLAAAGLFVRRRARAKKS